MKKYLNRIIITTSIFSLAFFSFFSAAFATTYQVDDFAAGTQVSQADSNTIIGKIVGIVFVIAAILAFAYLIYGAISWITSGGDKAKVEAARNHLTSAVIGLLILAAVWGIFLLVMQIAFGSENLNLPVLNS